jgi:16S rRNA (cytosine1402-N4)-methyltransferase
MLFASPTLASAQGGLAAPTAGESRVPGLGYVFLSTRTGALGTARPSGHPYTAVRSAFHGWLAERRPEIFQAGRMRLLGTVPPSLFISVIRAASGWLSARVAEGFPCETTGALGTARLSVHTQTAVRPAFHGWLAGRRPMSFLAGRKGFLGTVPLSLFNPVIRATSGWLCARVTGHSRQHFPSARTGALGTARLSGHSQTAVRPAFHGWLAGRRPSEIFQQTNEANGYHLSVLPAETVEWMAAQEGKLIIDGTLGGGGHSEAFLKAGASVIGIDRDPEALAFATKRLAAYGDRFRTWQGNFADLRDIPEVRGESKANGLLLDLGVSSRQLDAAERGFSFRGAGPLDMRMGPACPFDAAHVVNTWAESELVRIFFELGEEPKARRIAAAIVTHRAEREFTTTIELADCIEKVIGRHGRIHPATKAFQAIRMTVNDELGSLGRALEASLEVLKPGGRLLVITFHSLEDRMVKRFMQHRAKPWLDQPDWPAPRPNPDWCLHLPVRKAIAASDAEIRINPRARSAKLRVAELLDPTVSRP